MSPGAGVIAAAAVPHVPTLGLPENTPDFQLTLLEGARALARALRELKPDLFVVNSSHCIGTFGRYPTCQSAIRRLRAIFRQRQCQCDAAPTPRRRNSK